MDTYVLLKNGSVVYEGENDPRTSGAKEADAAAPGYNAADYPQRGAGMAAWQAAGRPNTDSQGRALDPAGWPVAWGGMTAAQGLALEAGAGGGGDPANADVFKGDVWARLADVDSTATVSGTCPADGKYYVEVGEQFDQLFTVQQNGAAVGSYPDALISAKAFPLVAGPCSIVATLNPKALTPEIIASRQAAGQGVSSAHYRVRKVG